MPSAIKPNASFDDLYRSIFRTRSALRRRDQRDLLALTDGWTAPIEGLRAQMLTNLEQRMDTDEERTVAGEDLATLADTISDALLKEVGKDRTDARYTAIFAQSPSELARLGLGERVSIMKSWIASADAVVVPFRDALRTATTAAQDALDHTAANVQATAALDQARRDHAAQLTAWRDELFETLSKRARELKKGRQWAGQFFRA